MKNSVEKLEAYKRQLAMSENSIVSHNYIVEVGAYTIGLDANNKTKLEIVNFPSQFTSKGVEEIKRAKFSNKNGNVEPKVVPYKEWYRKNIEALEILVAHGL